jgi:DinB superfamily
MGASYAVIGMLIAGGAVAAHTSQEMRMSEAERTEVIELLLKSEQEMLQAIDGLTDQQWTFKPAPERWSVAEVVEHIVLADALLFDTAVKALDGQLDEAWNTTLAKTEVLRKALPNRSRRVDAPAAIKPQQAMTRAALVSRFKEQRAKALAFVRATDKPLKAHTAPNPFFGSLNAHQWLLYIPLHHVRHNQQIAEVKASSGYPR